MPRRHASSGAAGAAPGSPPERVAVQLPLPVGGAYDYAVPAGLAVAPGDFVVVPLGGRQAVGVVWGPGGGAIADRRLKTIARRLPAPPLDDAMRRFIDWVAGYTLSATGSVLRMVMSVPEALEPPRPITAFAEGDTEAGARMTPARRRVLAVLADGPPRPAVELAREAGCGPGVVRAMADVGLLRAVMLTPSATFPSPDAGHAGPVLSADQAAAAAALRQAVAGRRYVPTLLDGVTGSGKTEVYFEAVAAALAGGRQVLVLLPEIALGAQWRERFAERFGAPPVEWHSDLTRARRRAVWRAVADGRAGVVVGARSALFLPFADLGLIVVDEEHEAAYKQEEGCVYQARDMAVTRASIADIPIVLVSATPALETVVNVARGRYGRLHLPDRHGGAALPEITVVDMRRDGPPRGRWLSPPLHAALAECFADDGQAMLFLNRRGYAPLTLCRRCGHRLRCPNCTIWLVEHRRAGRLRCHQCGYAMAPPKTCPSCAATDSFVACGPGIERLAEEVAADFPALRVAMVSSDTLHGPAAAGDLVRAVREHEVDLLIGTQILAKGHHFPNLILVGVIDADLGLAGGDLRAAERTYQLLTQVAGRAGRAARPGRVLVQTYRPEDSVIRALVSGDRDRFLDVETGNRRAAGVPPFGRYAAVIVSGRDEGAVAATARALARRAPSCPGVAVMGPAPAPLAILRQRHRHRLLVKADRTVHLQDILRHWLAAVKVPAGVRVKVDVDPYSFL